MRDGERVDTARRMVGARRLHAAAEIYAALVEGQSDARLWWEYGATLGALDDQVAAVRAFDRSLALDATRTETWNDRGVALVALQRDQEAQESFERALRGVGSRSAAAANLAHLLASGGDGERAEALYRSALRDDTANVRARIGLGRLLTRQARRAEAELELADARRRAPHDFDALLALVVFWSSIGAFDRALAETAHFLALSPGHSGGLGLHAELERERGGTEHPLLEADDWLRVLDLDVSPTLLDQVSGTLGRHQTLCHAPPHHATREGWHSGTLSSRHDHVLAQLETLLEDAVQTYAAPAHARNFWHQIRPRAVAWHTWAVRLGARGFQVPHLHPRGWLSGVLYLSVPEHVQHGSASNRGCLELGRPDPELLLQAPRASRFVRPVPGRLVLFPSWLYHSTVPHAGTGDRLSLAFDCVRAG